MKGGKPYASLSLWRSCFCMTLIIFLGIDGVHLLDSVTVISPTCSSPAKVKSAYRPGKNKTKNQDHLWQKTTRSALKYSNGQGLSPKWTIPHN